MRGGGVGRAWLKNCRPSVQASDRRCCVFGKDASRLFSTEAQVTLRCKLVKERQVGAWVGAVRMQMNTLKQNLKPRGLWRKTVTFNHELSISQIREKVYATATNS